jgi:hypothetical protein
MNDGFNVMQGELPLPLALTDEITGVLLRSVKSTTNDEDDADADTSCSSGCSSGSASSGVIT